MELIFIKLPVFQGNRRKTQMRGIYKKKKKYCKNTFYISFFYKKAEIILIQI